MRTLGLAFIVIIALFGFSPLHALATPFGAGESLTIKVDPDYPVPYSTVSVTPQSSLIALDRSDITITVNGVVAAKISGSQPVSVTLGGPGKTTTIGVTAAVDGTTYKKDFRITPQDLSLIMEPSATTHPLYAGALLLPSEGHLRIVALADFRTASGARIPASSLSYTWHSGDKLLSAQSGVGKMVLEADAPIRYRNAQISVTAVAPDQTSVAGASIPISPQDPVVRVYRNDPLMGPDYDNALSGSAALAGSEQTFRVIPYFFSTLPKIVWTVNSAASGSDRDITLRPTGTGAGSASIGVTASLTDQFQSAAQTFSVSFGASKPLGIFGL